MTFTDLGIGIAVVLRQPSVAKTDTLFKLSASIFQWNKLLQKTDLVLS